MIFRIASQVAIESFEDGALVLNLGDRSLIELNPTARDVLNLTDGTRSLQQVAESLAEEYQVAMEEVQQDVAQLYDQLFTQKIIEPVEHLNPKDGPLMTEISATARYLCNPDVVLREEDPDEGALLFNPDTNQVKVINTTALFIWQQCGQARTLDEIVAEVQKGFDEVPAEQVAQDVQEFVEGMLATGFIGTLME